MLSRSFVACMFFFSSWLNLNGQGITQYSYHDTSHKKIKEIYTLKDAKSGILSGKYLSYYLSGHIESEGIFYNNEPIGEWKFYFETGPLKMKMQVTGNEAGYWTYFYESGSKSMEGAIEKENRVGNWKFYYENGALKNEGTFVANLMEGQWKTFFESGVIKGIGIYSGNQGTYTEFYNNGDVSAEGNKIGFDNEGKWSYFYKRVSPSTTKQLQATGVYINGKKTDKWTYYYPNGAISSEGSYKNDDANCNWKYFYKNGKISSEGDYSNGLKDKEWTLYFSDGKLMGRGNYALGTGTYEEYFKTGKLKVKGQVVNGVNEGNWKYYYASGELEGTCDFVGGTGIYHGYYSDGTKKMMGNLQDNRRIGSWEMYDEKGELTGYYRPFYDDASISNDMLIVSPPDNSINFNDNDYTVTRNKIKYFKRKEDEFQGLVVGTNPLFLFAGTLPLALEFYSEDRLGYELELELIRDPFFESDANVAVDNIYKRGYALSFRQKFYNVSENPGLWYFGHELHYLNFTHKKNILVSPPLPAIQQQIGAPEQSIMYHLLFGYHLLEKRNNTGFSIDAFAGGGVGYRQLKIAPENVGEFSELPYKNVFLSFQFGLNFGYVFQVKK